MLKTKKCQTDHSKTALWAYIALYCTIISHHITACSAVHTHAVKRVNNADYCQLLTSSPSVVSE